MKIRWTFYFDKDHIPVDVTNSMIDEMIIDQLDEPAKLLVLESAEKKTLYIDLKQVKLVMREEIDEEEVVKIPEVEVI